MSVRIYSNATPFIGFMFDPFWRKDRSFPARFPDLGLTVDFAHLGLRGVDLGAFLETFKNRIRHAHVSGVIPGTPHGKVSLKASSLDLRPYLERIRDLDIAVVIENNSWEIMMESREVLEAVLR